MISHAAFSSPTLLEFCPEDSSYTYEEDEHGDLLVEEIRGIQFFRHSRVPSGTLFIEISLLDYSTDVGPAILDRIGIPLTRKSTLTEAIGLLGRPTFSKVDPERDYDSFRTDNYEFTVQPPSGYKVCCTWLHPGNVGRQPPLRVKELTLCHVRVERSDLASFPWES